MFEFVFPQQGFSLWGSYYSIRVAVLDPPARFPQLVCPRGLVTNLYVLKCAPEKVPLLAHSVPLLRAYCLWSFGCCVLSIQLCLRLVYAALHAELCVRSFGC